MNQRCCPGTKSVCDFLGYGCTSDGYTKFINCCLTNNHLEMVNNPVIFDVPVNADTKSLYVQNSKKMMKKINKK